MLLTRPPTRPLARIAAVALAATLASCASAPPDRLPVADFLLASGDSTFWVHTGPEGARIRRSPILLTRFDGRFYEIYVADDDRSFYDAVLVGQRIFRRDLISGDSVAVFDDSIVPALARAYAAAHPAERPLLPDEDASEDPQSVATSETEILDVFGPFLTFEHHIDVDAPSVPEAHETRRGVIDLRAGRAASLTTLFGDSAARRLEAAGRRGFELALDSVRHASDERGRRAAEALDGFRFDGASFALVERDGEPAVSFLVPGHGEVAAGHWLPLPAIPAGGGARPWWDEIAPTLPRASPDSTRDEWAGRGYDVVARYDGAADRVTVAIRGAGARREWRLGDVHGPARALHRLDDPPLDTIARRALARAFDEAARYSEEVRTVANRGAPPRRSVRRHRGPGRAPGVRTRSHA
jgi:hypothetical protein